MKTINKENPIGLFDSGVGGLTVVNSIKSNLPHENIVYVGDNYNCPYGNKTKEQLFTYASRIIEYFISRNVKMIVLACNTTSANILDKLQETYPDVKIIGVIDATVDDFINRRVDNTLIIATKATIDSNKYRDTIKDKNPNVISYSLATPKLVPLVESGMYKEGIYDTLHEYLDPYKGVVKSIILGCTHYPILKEQIKRVLPNIEYVSSSDAICKDVITYLEDNELLNIKPNPTIEIYTTGEKEEFIYSSSGFFDYTNIDVQHIDL